MSEQTPLLGQHPHPHHVNAPSPIHRLSSPRISFPSTSTRDPTPSTRGKNRLPPSRQTSFPFYATPSPVDTPDQGRSDSTLHGGDKTRTRQSRFTSKHVLSPSEFSSSGLSSMSDDSAMTVDEEGQTHFHLHKDHHHRSHHHHHHRHSGVYGDEQDRHARRHVQTGQRAEPDHFGLRKDGLPKLSRQCLWSEIKCYGSYILPPLFIFGVLAIGSGLIYVAIKRKWI